MLNHPLVSKALIFATKSHGAINQKRKYVGDDYIVHPIEVAKIVSGVASATPEMVCAALLHDVVEDTGVLLETIRVEFGDKVASLVSDLTDVSKKEDGSRRVRKNIDLLHTSKASPEAKTIKLADLISNAQNIVSRDPSFAVVYLKEKADLLGVLKEGDAVLYKKAQEVLKAGLDTLKIKKT